MQIPQINSRNNLRSDRYTVGSSRKSGRSQSAGTHRKNPEMIYG